MSFSILVTLICALLGAVLLLQRRRMELVGKLSELDEAKLLGSYKAKLQYPQVDLSLCIGCGTCIQACPEDGVLRLIHGQAVVVHGSRCVGHGVCAKECPLDAIEVTLGDLSARSDIPALTDKLESVTNPGLFLAGEVTGAARVRNAIVVGTSVAAEIAERCRETVTADSRVLVRQGGPGPDGGRGARVHDLCVVGAGPAGLACSLEAKRLGIDLVTLEQEEQIGGTVGKYPKRKLVMTQPVHLPLHGKLKRTTYLKEELMDIWQTIARQHELPVRLGETFIGLERSEDGSFEVKTRTGAYRARHVCLALGRRGSPRKLGVDGEDLPKVAYSLVDAEAYQGRNILVVGGGDSAIEAACSLADQPGNRVTLSYRKEAFFRIKKGNQDRFAQAVKDQKLDAIFQSTVSSIQADRVKLRLGGNNGSPPEEKELPNDEVFVFAGGIPPFKLLKDSGVSFDHDPAPPFSEEGPGLRNALLVALVLALAMLGWRLAMPYYGLEPDERPHSAAHDLLRPSGIIGILLGAGACFFVLVNFSYLIRRSRFGNRIPGSLQMWMTSHIVTGILAMLLALAHAAMSPRNTVGGHAFGGLVLLVITGGIGRYFYVFVPHATNGTELKLDDLQARFAAISSEWDQGKCGFSDRVRREMDDLVRSGRWRGSFFRRVSALLSSQRRLRRALARMRELGRAEELPKRQLKRILGLARRAHRTALMAEYYEDLRCLLASWRFFHRWIGWLVLLLIVIHVWVACRFGTFEWMESWGSKS
ncbi:MAG: NAD(P)-binding domain-containing protein [Planctomycetota bacterium]